MTERDALIRAILEAPADDAPRLVFADWLEENGWEGPAAELRRAVREARVQLGSLEQALGLGRHPPAPPPDWSCWVSGHATIRGGFIERVKLPTPQFMAVAGQLFTAHPVSEVSLTDVRPKWFYWAWSWQWESDGDWHRTGQHVLPAPVFGCLDAQVADGWPGSKAAHQALSRACVRYGRGLAGLSPLPGS